MREAADFWVGDRLVRPTLGEIRLGLERVRLEPRSMAVLLALAERPREVMGKKDLIERVWGEAFVSDEVLTHAIWDLRRAFGDNARSPEFIQTIPKRGYRLIAPVRVADKEPGAGVAAGPSARGRTPAAGGERAGRPGAAQRGWRLLALTLLVVVAGLAVGLAALAGRRAEDREEAARRQEALAAIAERNERDPYMQDPDIRLWTLGVPKSPAAVSEFLTGVRYVFKNEEGAEEHMKAAIAHDPTFVAPRVWRLRNILQRADAAETSIYRAGLEALQPSATVFEKTMIDWVEAVLDGKPALQSRALRAALDEAPGNRILLLNLARTELEMENPQGCWNELQPLLDGRWRFPGLYTLAAVCAVALNSVGDAKAALEAALDHEPVDPEVYDLLRVLATYRGDEEAEAELGALLAARVRQMEPESYESIVGGLAELLAGKADEEGREGISRRLRESVD